MDAGDDPPVRETVPSLSSTLVACHAVTNCAPAGDSKNSNVSHLTGFLGAKLGANSARHKATLRYAEPESSQVNGMSGDAWPHLATG
jgi:hypothetical protein